VQHFLSEADETWTGQRGRINRSVLETLLDVKEGLGVSESLNQEPTFFCICGPTPFTELTKRLIRE
jgi:Oxidoreductase NAD-binding domain